MPKKYVSTAPDAGHSKDEGGDKAMKYGFWNFGHDRGSCGVARSILSVLSVESPIREAARRLVLVSVHIPIVTQRLDSTLLLRASDRPTQSFPVRSPNVESEIAQARGHALA
jgi:hypothetical protein